MGGKSRAPAAAASDEPMEPMIAKGNADNTVKAQANHLKIGNQFLEHAGAVFPHKQNVDGEIYSSPAYHRKRTAPYPSGNFRRQLV